MTSVWDPIRVGTAELPHRLALAPMTRSRALPDGTPHPSAATYYAQRAGLGLLITEGVQPSADGQGYLNTPGIHTDAHVAGWRAVADAVHAAGGTLFLQLMHAGRIAHPDNRPHGGRPVAPSAVTPDSQMFTVRGMLDIPEPRALTVPEIRATVEDFRQAARRAVEAGADGVELHGANGYLIQQFLGVNSNVRTDGYGGGVEGRVRFALEVVRAVAAEIGPERTALRISPGGTHGDIDEGADGPAAYRHLVRELAPLGLAYLHVFDFGDEALLRDIRALWPRPLLLLRSERSLESFHADVESGLADVLPVGRWALANPDFVERYRTGTPLTEADPATFFGGDHRGYTDYPTADLTPA